MITGQDLRAARQAKRVGLDTLAQRIGRTKSHLSRVERGVDDRDVTPALIRDYERALGSKIVSGTNATKLANADTDGHLRDQPNALVSLHGEGLTPLHGEPPATVRSDRLALAATSEWPVWFGIQLAHLIEEVGNWQGRDAEPNALQNLLHQEILMFDAVALDSPDPVHALSRRQALATLAALPVTLSSSTGFTSSNAATEMFLARCAAGLTACWHLLKGSDIYTVDRFVSSYIVALEGIAQTRSPHQENAARLASQAHRICGIVALHRNHLRVREYHCKQALSYATISSDISSRVSALISLASTFFYDMNPRQAATIYEQALSFEGSMPPLQRSRVHAELSVVYGQLGRERETLRSAEVAEHLYPGDPERDPSFLYAEFTRASLALELGLSHIALAEHYPERGYQRIAADAFAGVQQTAQIAVPDRIRFEIVNHQARTAVLLNDFDAFETYVRRGASGAAQLGSKQRRKEIQTAWRHAHDKWPNEPRLKAIGRQLPLAIES